ncbi:hypothetical protein D3C81_1069230 [compost metagenome]
MVADNAVGQPESKVVHRPGRRHANIPIADAAGIILHAAVSARLQHFDTAGLEAETVQHAGPHATGLELRGGNHLPQVIQIRRDAVQPGGIQRQAHFLQRLLAILAVNNQLGDHRVVKCRHFTAGGDPTVHPYPIREMHLGQYARAGLEVFQRIFGIDTHLNRCPLRWALQRRPVQRIPRRHLQHAFDQVQPGHTFSHRMLHLQTGVHFEEIKLVARAVVDKLHGAGAAIINRRPQCHRRLMQRLTGGRRQVRCRGLFHHFLVAALQ